MHFLQQQRCYIFKHAAVQLNLKICFVLAFFKNHSIFLCSKLKGFMYHLKINICPSNALKGQCHEIFDIFYQKTVTQNFSFLQRYLRKTCVHDHVVNNYADMISALSITTLTSCQRSQRLGGHRASVVNNYADTVSALSRTTWTLLSKVKDYMDIVSA